MSSDKENNDKDINSPLESMNKPDDTSQYDQQSFDLLLKNFESSTVLPTVISEPDFEKLKQERLDRNRKAMAKVSPMISTSSSSRPNNIEEKSVDQQAAICLQRHYRGRLGRKLYVKQLQQQFEQEEKERQIRQKEQVEEGELLIESHKLELEITNDFVALRNRERRILYYVTVIQRAWRRYKQRKIKTTVQPQRIAHDRFPVKEYLI